MNANWLILIPQRNQLWLQVGTECLWLHSKRDIHPNQPPMEEGWKSDRLSIKLEDRHAQHIMYDWHANGPFDLSTGEQCMMRLPDAVREIIEFHPSFLNQAV